MGPLRRWSVVLAGLLGLVACGTSAPPSVLLVTLDTLRADHVGAYGALDVRTPRIDRLAREGMTVERAAAPMALTRPSHFSIFTSRYPREHGVMNNTTPLPAEALTLAEILQAHGYRTAAFVAVSLLDEESGAAQGFDAFASTGDERLLDARDVVPRAREWLQSVAQDEAFFLWVHLFDPHLPYGPPERYRTGLDPRLSRALPEVSWQALTKIADGNGGDVPRDVLEHARALYRGEVEYTDHWVGELLDALQDRGRLNQTLVVLTADHGESFENGVFFEHADSLQEHAIRVPLVFRLPGRIEAGVRLGGQASAVDVAPTILRALGLEPPAGCSGRSLLEPIPAERCVLVQSPFYQPAAVERRARIQRSIRTVGGEPVRALSAGEDVTGLVGTEWRLLRSGEESRLYRTSDVDERQDLAQSHAEVRTELEASLAAELRARPLKLLDPAGINTEMLETLRALGYFE